jgi:hypothetical protein
MGMSEIGRYGCGVLGPQARDFGFACVRWWRSPCLSSSTSSDKPEIDHWPLRTPTTRNLNGGAKLCAGKLQVTAAVDAVTTHPDDEWRDADAGARGGCFDSATMTLTRGEGGQNGWGKPV